MATYFIADLHLQPEIGAAGATSASAELVQFQQFIERCQVDGDALYILGDLFEVWIGDDAGLGHYPTAISCLKQLELPLFLLHGNRDFLIGEAFCAATGCQLLAQPTMIRCQGSDLLIAHGDQLCTDDIEYQQMRGLFQQPQWRAEFLAQPIELRAQQAANLRDQSRTESSQKAQQIMDVNDRAVVELLEQQQALTLIHGHTHRPAQHQHETKSGEATRWVVGSWQQHGDYVRWDENGPALLQACR